MIGFRFDQARSYFDPRPVTRSVDAAGFRALGRFGAYVRTSARSSMRKRKRAAEEGQPPSSHLGLIRQFLLFAVDRNTRSVVIGATKLPGKIGAAPEALEKGGDSMLLKMVRGRQEQVRGRWRKFPYMQPAFAGELPKLPAMLEGQARP